jgi:hypothetical protein
MAREVPLAFPPFYRTLVGREDTIQNLSQYLRGSRRHVLVVSGFFGVGKTALVQACFQRLEIEPLWLSSDVFSDAPERLDTALREASQSKDFHDRFVVLDEAGQLSQDTVSSYIRRLLNYEIVRKLVVVTANPFPLPFPTEYIRLEPLSLEDSTSLMESLSSTELSNEDLVRLVTASSITMLSRS